MSGWRVLIEGALARWSEPDPELRIAAVDWLMRFLDGPEHVGGEPVFEIDGLFVVEIEDLGVHVTYLVKPFHRVVVVKHITTSPRRGGA